jgi:hypothetical protein
MRNPLYQPAAIQTVGEGKQPMGGALGVRMEIVGAACAISG